MLMEDRHFNKSNLEDDGKSYWLIRLWWHPSGSPWGSPMSSVAGRESGPSQRLLNYGWRGKGGGVDQDSWEKHSTYSDTHTHTHTKAVVWGQACCEGGCGWVELFACVSFWRGCLRGLPLKRGELGNLSDNLPLSLSTHPPHQWDRDVMSQNILCGVSQSQSFYLLDQFSNQSP